MLDESAGGSSVHAADERDVELPWFQGGLFQVRLYAVLVRPVVPVRLHQLGERQEAVVTSLRDPYAEIGVGVLAVYV